MPSRKQRRRRQKARRHEYEYVYVDAEGRELEADPAEDTPEKEGDGRRRERPAVRAAGGRTIQPPSWRRVGRRALIFAPLMLVFVTFFGGAPNLIAGLGTTVVMLGFFLPFSYLMDTLLYRAYLRRTGQAPSGTASRRR